MPAFFSKGVITMGGHSKRSCSSYPSPTPPVIPPHYLISGDGIPDANGRFFEAGIWELKPYYKHESKNFYLFWEPTENRWRIADSLEGFSGYWQNNVDDVPDGNYSAFMGYQNTPVVTHIE
jgi:hypothetical protein